MSEFTDEDVIRYVLGAASPEATAALRSRAAEDKELAATVELLSQCTPVSFANLSQPPRRRRYSPTGARRIALALIAAFAASGLAWAGWTILAEKPLLEDRFDSNWGDPNKWTTPRRSVFVENGHVRLFDRGYLVTAKEYPGPIELTFRWRWTDLVGDFNYRDDLTIALRTSGIPKSAFAFEITDGVVIKLFAYLGRISIRYASGEDIGCESAAGSFPMPSDTWQTIRVTDDGETIAVYFGNEANRARGIEPAVTMRSIRPVQHRRIAFYNRERLASASHESWIDDVVLRRLNNK